MLNKILIFLYGFLVGALVLLSVKEAEKHYVYVDVEKVILEVVKNLKDTDEKQIDLKIEEHKKKFESDLTDYQNKNNSIIFSSPKPIKGAEDKTDYFIKKLIWKSLLWTNWP